MYTPSHFAETRIEVMQQLMQSHRLATIVHHGDGGLDANHIPLLIDPSRGRFGTLVGHVARANPLWREDTSEVLVIFQGPQAYITPSWYVGKPIHGKVVPTWNYAVVHVSGRVTRIDGDGAKWLIVHDLAMQYEADAAAPWDARGLLAHAGKLGAIVGFEMAIERIDAKFKLTQNRSVADQQGVISALQGSDSSEAQATATLMRENLRAV